MGVIVVVCAAFGSEAKTEIICLRTKRMPESIAIFNVEEAGQVYSQVKEFVYLGESINDNANLSIASRSAHTQRIGQLPEGNLGTVRLAERSPRAQNPNAKSQGTRVNAVRLRHVEPARVPLRQATPRPPQVPDSLHGLAKE